MMDFLVIIYARIGAQYPGISLAIAAIVGALVFGSGWWFIGEKHRNQTARPAALIVDTSQVAALESRLSEKNQAISQLQSRLEETNRQLESERQSRARAEAVVKGQSDKQASVVKQLSEFIKEGFAIKSEWASRLGQDGKVQTQSAVRVGEWHDKVRDYLNGAVGDSYAVRFDNIVRSQGLPDGIQMSIAGRWQDLDGYLSKLDEFMKELR